MGQARSTLNRAPAAKHSRRGYWAIATVLAAAYVLVCVRGDLLLFQDYPGHLARAVVMSDLLLGHGREFGESFQYQFLLLPYILGDLILIGAVHVLGVAAATALWTALAVLSLPLAVLYLLRASDIGDDTRSACFLLSLYLSTDWFFLLGFLNFRLAVALVLFALGIAQPLRQRLAGARYAAYCLVVLFGYLMHLAFIVFLTAALCATGLAALMRRRTSLRRECLLLLPIALLLLWHVAGSILVPAEHEVVAATYVWGTLPNKVRRLDWDLIRFDEPVDLIFMGVLAAGALWVAWGRINRGALLLAPVMDQWVLAIAFVALYLGLPKFYGDPGYIDVRALAIAIPCALYACLLLPAPGAAGPGARGAVLVTAAALFAAVNMAYLWRTSAHDRAWLQQYRVVVAALPQGARVLPVYTYIRQGYRFPQRHADSFVVIDRGAFDPYMFSGDQGQPMKYFRYRNRPYAPPDNWYTSPAEVRVDWSAVRCNFEYLLLTRPFDPERLPLRMRLVVQNDSAALLQFQPGPCDHDISPAGP